MVAQMKVVGDTSGMTISVVRSQEHPPNPRDQSSTTHKPVRECWNCGRIHEYHQKDICPAYGKTCSKCLKPNHFAVKCRSKNKPTRRSIKAIDDDNAEEVFSHTNISHQPG